MILIFSVSCMVIIAYLAHNGLCPHVNEMQARCASQLLTELACGAARGPRA